MIRFTNISKRYPGGYEALSNISFHMEKVPWRFSPVIPVPVKVPC